MIDASPYTVPKEPGRWRAIALAALVHAALLAFLWIGVRWQNQPPATIEAEVWDPQMREAAPRPEPVTEPEPEPEVKEMPKPKAAEPPAAKPEPKIDQPDIALEQEKKRKAREEQKRLEEEREEKERLAKKKAEEERLAKKKAEEEKLAKLKKEEEKKQLEKAENEKKLAAEKKRKQEEAEAKMLAKMREENLRRMTEGVAGSGGGGDAARSQGNRGDASYAQRVGAKIKSNINFTVSDDMAAGNPAVEYLVELLPDGSVGGIRLKKTSGVPGFDEAVRRAIEKAQPYPKDKSGAVPSSFIGIHRLKDQ